MDKREPTEKQQWAVNLILKYADNVFDKPEFDFDAYSQFIDDHREEYKRAKVWHRCGMEGNKWL